MSRVDPHTCVHPAFLNESRADLTRFDNSVTWMAYEKKNVVGIYEENVMIDPDGSFSFTDNFGNSFAGNFSTSQVSGTYVDYLGHAGSFSAAKSSSEGNFVNVSGFYTGSAQGNFTYGSVAGQFYGYLRVLVDATGKSFSLLMGSLNVGGAVYAWVVTGGFINLSPNNKIDGYLLDGTHVTGTFDPVNPKGSGNYYYSSGTYTNSGTWNVAQRYSLGSSFVDVQRTHWAYQYIEKLVESGITAGSTMATIIVKRPPHSEQVVMSISKNNQQKRIILPVIHRRSQLVSVKAAIRSTALLPSRLRCVHFERPLGGCRKTLVFRQININLRPDTVIEMAAGNTSVESTPNRGGRAGSTHSFRHRLGLFQASVRQPQQHHATVTSDIPSVKAPTVTG